MERQGEKKESFQVQSVKAIEFIRVLRFRCIHSRITVDYEASVFGQ